MVQHLRTLTALQGETRFDSQQPQGNSQLSNFSIQQLYIDIHTGKNVNKLKERERERNSEARKENCQSKSNVQ